MRVDFKFEPKQKVKTPFGDVGFVSSCDIGDDMVNRYFVKRDRNSQWYREDELEIVQPNAAETLKGVEESRRKEAVNNEC